MRYGTGMIALLSAALIGLAAAPTEDDFDPTTISEVDALQCRLDVSSYNGFAFAITGEEQVARKGGWRKADSGNQMLDEYELPAPIRIGSWSTRRIASGSSRFSTWPIRPALGKDDKPL